MVRSRASIAGAVRAWALLVAFAASAAPACSFQRNPGGQPAGGDGATGAGGRGFEGSGGAPPPMNSGRDGPLAAGCKKVDLVIAVDASSSMKEEMQALSSMVFPAMAEKLKAVGGGLQDFRVGVLSACPAPADYRTRGAKTTDCQFAGGHVWMESSSPRLTEEFACVGDVYIGNDACTGDNDDEQPASAAAASLEPPAATGPNAGFSRPDALLVVMAITDEDEQPTPDRTAQQVHDRLVAAKGGAAGNLVFLGVGGSMSCMGAYGSAGHAAKLQAITDLFIADKRGVFWDLCQGHLEDGLQRAIDIVETACGDFHID